MLTWSVNLNPLRLSPSLDTRAMNERLDRLLPRLTELGIGMVRTDLLWHFLVPEAGKPDAAGIEWMRQFLDRLKKGGMGTYAILYNPPAWAIDLAQRDEKAFAKAWSLFVMMCAEAFGSYVQLWQVWNEPNNYFSHVKDDFNLFWHRRIRIPYWEITLPVSVRWEVLSRIYNAARNELGKSSRIATNFLSNMGNMAPISFPDWIEWDVFLERMMERLHGEIDVLALDHYPDTWVPGIGPLDWEPLTVLLKKIQDPRSACYGKAAIISELGYSSCTNAKLPLGLKFFPEDHSEARMSEWYAHVLPHLAFRMGSDSLPRQDLHIVNIYELVDAAPASINGQMDLVDIEYHFGLLRWDLTPKPAFDVVRQAISGSETIQKSSAWARTGPFQVYLEASRMSRGFHRWAGPRLLALYRMITPSIRHHDRLILALGAVWVLTRAIMMKWPRTRHRDRGT